MGSAIGAFLGALILGLPLTGACAHYWQEVQRIRAEAEPAAFSFRRWLLLGLVFPLVWWLAWNIVALSPTRSILPPLVAPLPELLSGPSGGAVPVVLANGALLLSFHMLAWAAVTFLWLLPRIRPYVSDEASFRATTLTVSLITVALLVWPIWKGSATGVMLLALGWGWFLVHGALLFAVREVPTYGRAIAHMKFGRYEQAEAEVIEQLNKKEDDFEGWIMLAEMYAEHFGEMDEASRAIVELCDQPGLTPYQQSKALNRLADWYLRIDEDPAAARQVLNELVRRLPDTPFALQAEHRIRELPISREEARERRRPKTVRLPALSENTLAPPNVRATPKQRERWREQATRLQERLEVYPDETPARERLARILAEGLGEIENGARQLRHLLEHADPAHPRRAEWLGLQAAWLLRFRNDAPGARKVLEQIAREYPGTPQAFAATRQMEVLDQPPPVEPVAPAPLPRIVVSMPVSSTPTTADTAAPAKD